jgi:hypothetical protein
MPITTFIRRRPDHIRWGDDVWHIVTAAASSLLFFKIQLTP